AAVRLEPDDELEAEPRRLLCRERPFAQVDGDVMRRDLVLGQELEEIAGLFQRGQSLAFYLPYYFVAAGVDGASGAGDVVLENDAHLALAQVVNGLGLAVVDQLHRLVHSCGFRMSGRARVP